MALTLSLQILEEHFQSEIPYFVFHPLPMKHALTVKLQLNYSVERFMASWVSSESFSSNNELSSFKLSRIQKKPWKWTAGSRNFLKRQVLADSCISIKPRNHSLFCLTPWLHKKTWTPSGSKSLTGGMVVSSEKWLRATEEQMSPGQKAKAMFSHVLEWQKGSSMCLASLLLLIFFPKSPFFPTYFLWRGWRRGGKEKRLLVQY